jgi:hypothetical protein
MFTVYSFGKAADIRYSVKFLGRIIKWKVLAKHIKIKIYSWIILGCISLISLITILI